MRTSRAWVQFRTTPRERQRHNSVSPTFGAHILETQLQPTEIPFVTSAAGLVLIFTLLASVLAARRATLISPAEALRHE
jgi:ABC-type lipoprotein release transport system permease subunit